MGFEESSPGHAFLAGGRGLDAVVLKDAGDGVSRDVVSEVGEGVSDAGVSPGMIFCGEAENEMRDALAYGAWPSCGEAPKKWTVSSFDQAA
jgi:hypothetical protein